MDWTPQKEGLDQLLQLLRDSLSTDNKVQTEVQQRLDSFNQIRDYNCYLMHILIGMPQESSQIRAIAGLLLKNNVRMHYPTMEASVLDYIRYRTIEALSDPDPVIRSTASTLVTTLVTRGGVASWPQLFPGVLNLLEQGAPPGQAPDGKVEGALQALDRVCEDSAVELDVEVDLATPGAGTQRVKPLSFLLPKLLSLFSSPSPKVRALAMSCTNHVLFARSETLFAQSEQYLAALFGRATSEEDPTVRRHICQALVTLLEVRFDLLLPHMADVANYMLARAEEEDDSVALEACEFWLSFAEASDLRPHLNPYVPSLVPVLLGRMKYGEMDILMLDHGDDDPIEDREQDMKPRHHKAKTVGVSEKSDSNKSHPSGADGAGEDDDDEDDDDDDEDEDDMYNEWTVRKCSAATLDMLATEYGDAILPSLLPLLKERLSSEDWLERESGILALGAIAEGCLQGMEPHLPGLLPYLLEQLTGKKPLIRSITCWTLSRYTDWLVASASLTPEEGGKSSEDAKAHLLQVMEGLLKGVNDRNKKVQEAACSAFATLEETAATLLIPFLQPILQALVPPFSFYGRRNLQMLYDVVGSLADAVGPALASPDLIPLILPPLLDKYAATSDDDTHLFSLLECLTSVATSLGPTFLPYAPPVWERALSLCGKTIAQWQGFCTGTVSEAPDKDFLIVSLDLLSGMVQGLGSAVEPMVQASQPPLWRVVGACMQDPSHEVRQSAYALLGDMAISVFSHIQPHLSDLMPELIGQVDPNSEFVSVCNNAAWAGGEIALKFGEGMATYVPSLLERLIPLLGEGIQRTLSENAAIAIGRLGLSCPSLVAPSLAVIGERWCKALRIVSDNNEKESAFRGFCAMIQANPSGLSPVFPYFVDAVIQWQTPSAELNDMFTKIIRGFKEFAGANWDSYVTHFPPPMRQLLQERYGV